ncbi:Astacin [Diplonema papillatum]|nr:Astacin [Diplonema papillatum]
MMLAYLCIGLAFIPEFEERSIQCLMDAGSAPDAILTHPRPPLFTLSDGPPQPPNLPTPADSNPAAYYLQDDDDRNSWAVANWEEETCIRFTKCSSPFTCEEPFMVFVSDASRCDAPVGTSGCVSEVNIRTIRYQGWVAHVTAHALGLSRENTRNDRDGYVTLNESNIWSKSERAADRCRAIADGAAFRRGRGEEDGFVEFHSEGHLQPVVHEAPVVVRARVAPRGAKLLEVAGSFSTNFAVTISDVSVATCSVVARMAAGTTDAPPSAVPQTAAPAPCTWHAASASPSPPRAYGGWFERDRYGSHTAVGCCEDRPWTRPSSVTAADTVWDPLILPDLTHAIDAPCLPRLPQPPRSILRSLPARQRRLMRAAVRRRSMLRAQRATLEGTTDNVLVPHARASPLVLGGGCTQNTSVAVNPVRPPPSTTTLATTSVPPAPDTPALLSFWVCDPSGKHRHCTVDSETVVGDFFAQSTWFDPDVCWISQGTRQLVLSDSFAENAVNRDDTLTVMVRLLGGGGRGSWRGGKGNRGGRGAGSSGTSVPSAPAGDASSGTKGHKGGKSRRGNGPPDGLVWSDGARDCDKADLYRDWEFPEMRFRAVFPLHVFDGDVTHASWEEVSGSPFQWGQYYLHSVLTRGAVNSCWDAAAKQEFSRGEVYQTLEIHFSANAADEVDILRASGYQGAYFEPLNSQDYRVLLVPDRADMGEVSSIAAKIDHLQLGLSYCRGELGVRVRASSYAEARQLLPDLPAEIAYFAVAGIPCGSNANTLQRNLTRLGWNVTPLFKTAKSGRYAEWAVKSETLPGRFDCDLLNGMRITIKRVDRYPIQPSRHIASVRLSSSYRDESNTLRCDVHEGSTPVPYSVFLERYGKAASTLWELAGKSSTTDGADGSSFGNDGTPLAGGSEVGLTSYAKATLRPCSSPPPARANPTSSSSPSSSPVNPPRAVADIDELELQSLVRSLVKEATSSTASAPVPRVAPLPEQPPTQDAAAFKEFVGSIVRESVADMEKKRAPTLGACEVATLVENSVGACVAQKVSEAVAGPLLEVTAQLKLMGERMTTLAARVDEVQSSSAGKGANKGSKMTSPSPTPERDMPLVVHNTSEQSQTLVAAPPAEASLGLVPYSQNLVSTELAQPLVNRPQKLDAMKVAMPVLDGDSVKENVKIITALHKKMKSTRPRSRSLTLSQDSTASQHSAANQALLADVCGPVDDAPCSDAPCSFRACEIERERM